MSDLLTNVSLEEAMIRYAIFYGSSLHLERGWSIFKLRYPCSDTSGELHAKFWNDIMPNINDNDYVKSNVAFAFMLNNIEKPRALASIPAVNYPNVIIKPWFTLVEEERARQDRKDRSKLNNPEMLALKKDCLKLIADHRPNIDRTNSHRSQSDRATLEGQGSGLPGLSVRSSEIGRHLGVSLPSVDRSPRSGSADSSTEGQGSGLPGLSDRSSEIGRDHLGVGLPSVDRSPRSGSADDAVTQIT